MSTKLDSEKTIQRKKFWDRFTFVLIAIYLVICVVFSISLIYQKTYFDLTWVNGQSMYPFFNLNAENVDGTKKGRTPSSAAAQDGEKNFDCVLVDGHEETFKKLERFDIVVLTHGVKDLIKRVLVLPGETFFFVTEGENKGQLFIQNENSEFDEVVQPIPEDYLDDADYHLYESPTTLQANEYVVCGDNRGNSSDSLSFGPVKRNAIKGIVVAVVGTCDAISVDDGPLKKVTYTNIRYSKPRFLK